MSASALHATAFYTEVAAKQLVFTLLEEDSFPVLRIDGSDVVPFWSSRSRVERVRAEHSKYANHVIEEISLPDFLAKTLALLEEERIRVGVNWSGPRLTGYDVSVSDVRSNVAHRLRSEG
ncbi:DUF2750 domain-containing protein [Ramlibacter sp. WS9]|uniref:DUF2750 domain-containing protein n=1 Tax=Ramlibacter sp. WS9 TaxID=1882741 RepID=UPI001143CEBE|nr:DUF2750 domain-containing protein [Ramlibacter sp. WS9]ROZ61477.1 DUF2750 domain-containing protein [Ramlibacter sp. WS9]